jgi:hypothetical protein
LSGGSCLGCAPETLQQSRPATVDVLAHLLARLLAKLILEGAFIGANSDLFSYGWAAGARGVQADRRRTGASTTFIAGAS